MTTTLRTRAALVGAFALVAVALAGCGSPAATDTGSDTGTDTEQTDTEQSDGGDTFQGAVLSGDGSYAIPDEMPYGSYQMSGEPASQPDGCTWAILDADGATYTENNGPYVFIEDIEESVTFTTAGCPDWEQYE